MVASKREPGNNKVNQLRETFLSYAEAKKMFSVQASKVRGSISVAEPSLSKTQLVWVVRKAQSSFQRLGANKALKPTPVTAHHVSCCLVPGAA
jgi:hypothetical protein